MGDAGNELYVVGLGLTKRPKDVLLQKLLANACMYALAQNDPLTDPPTHHSPTNHPPSSKNHVLRRYDQTQWIAVSGMTQTNAFESR